MKTELTLQVKIEIESADSESYKTEKRRLIRLLELEFDSVDVQDEETVSEFHENRFKE